MNSLKLISNICFIIITSYIIGSFPTSIIISKLFKGIDIRNYGSGNAGATNTFRVLGWKAGLLVALIDIFKGFAATFWISRIYIFNVSLNAEIVAQILAGASAVFGHCYTIFANFRGGKGIAASAGMLIALFPTAFLVCLGVFTAVLLLSGYVSLSSISAAIALPITLFIIRFVFVHKISMTLIIFSLFICVFILYTHRSNIIRLIKGTENRFTSLSFSKKQ